MERCEHCRALLNIDGGCEVCWTRRSRKNASEFARQEELFFDGVIVKYEEFVHLVMDWCDPVFTMKEYLTVWGEKPEEP